LGKQIENATSSSGDAKPLSDKLQNRKDEEVSLHHHSRCILLLFD
jgi:hypothetical protein